MGAEFRFNETVTAIDIAGGRVCGVKTDQGDYGADVVINAAGAWATPLARLVGMDVPVKPDSHEAAITEAVAPFLKPMVVDIRPVTGSANYYFYQHATGQIVFCITPSPSLWGEDIRETSEFLPMVAKRMVEVMPRLKNIRVRRTWRGSVSDDAGWLSHRRMVQGSQRLLARSGHVRTRPYARPWPGRVAGSHGHDTRLVESDQEILNILSPYRQFAGQEKLK